MVPFLQPLRCRADRIRVLGFAPIRARGCDRNRFLSSEEASDSSPEDKNG